MPSEAEVLAGYCRMLERRIAALERKESPAGGSWPGYSDAEGDPAAVAGAAADGTSAYPARRDHVHVGATAGHNHDAAYLALGGGTLTGALTVTGALSASGRLSVGGGEGFNYARYIPAATVTLADSAVQSLGSGADMNGFLFIVMGTDGAGALFYLRAGANATVELLDSNGIFSVTKDTASSLNCYYDTDGYYLQNKRGGNRTLYVHFLSNT